LILFAEFYWLLGLEVRVDDGLVEERADAVARAARSDSKTSTGEFDPYDRQWDGLMPIERDPLTRMRLLVSRLTDSIKLDDGLLRLKPFDRRE
jgi:hypothetical protein